MKFPKDTRGIERYIAFTIHAAVLVFMYKGGLPKRPVDPTSNTNPNKGRLFHAPMHDGKMKYLVQRNP